MSKILLFILLFLLCFGSVSASVVTRYGSDFKIVGDKIFFKVSDRLSSDRLTLQNEAVVAESNILPYGQQLKNSNVKFGFTGKELDDTNNYYFNARYYDFDSGKFLGVDPVSDNHAYAYVSNNPMNYIDPSGAEVTNADGLKFWLANPEIASKYKLGISLDADEKKTAFDWFANYYKDDQPYAYKYLQQYLHPEQLVSSRSAEWYGDVGTESEGAVYPVYDVRPDFDKEGFDIDDTLQNGVSLARHKDKILELFNAGKETMILVEGFKNSPISFSAMGYFAFYVQKDLESGKVILRLKDKYDWFLEKDPTKSTSYWIEGDVSEFSNFGVPKESEQGDVKMVKWEDSTHISLCDGYLDNTGQEYIMWGEWEITEELFLEYFGPNEVSSSGE